MKQFIDKQQILGFVMVCLTIGSKTCEKKPHVPDDFSRLWGCDFDPWKRFWSCESVESGHDSMMIQIVITDSRIFSIMNIYIIYILYIYININIINIFQSSDLDSSSESESILEYLWQDTLLPFFAAPRLDQERPQA